MKLNYKYNPLKNFMRNLLSLELLKTNNKDYQLFEF